MGSSHGFESGLQGEPGRRGIVIDGMVDGAATRGPLSSPAPGAHRCAAAGLDSGPPAERWAFMPFDDAVDRVKLARPRMGSGGDRPQRPARPSLRSVCVAVLHPPPPLVVPDPGLWRP